MRAMEDLKDMLMVELDEISEKGELNAGDLETVHKLTDTIKNIEKIKMYGGYSNGWKSDGYGKARLHYNKNYDDESYGRHWVRGHYSMGEGREAIVGNIREMMNDDSLSNAERAALKKAMESFQ